MFFPIAGSVCVLCPTYIDFEQCCLKSEQSLDPIVPRALPDLLFISIIYRFMG